MRLAIGQLVNWKRRTDNTIRRIPAKVLALTGENAQILLETPIKNTSETWVRRSSLERRTLKSPATSSTEPT